VNEGIFQSVIILCLKDWYNYMCEIKNS